MSGVDNNGNKPFTDADLGQLIKNYFEVSKYPGMYVLGCFARYATLYSQQVRAFNLAYGLHLHGKISAGMKVAVVGTGAAGLTVAAGMADLGCSVTILDEHAGPMELQRNSRQRWIHPFLYDWPKIEKAEDRARLPILDWSAGYADKVALEIERDWDAFLKALPERNLHAVRTVLSVRGLKYFYVNRKHHLTWDYPREGSRSEVFDRIVLAVGYGLEPLEPGRNSYWEDDGIDAGFRSKSSEEPWLVTGGGDAGLIDLMRICIKDFRHKEVIDYFRSLPGVTSLADELSKLEREGTSDEKLSNELSMRIKGLLENKLTSKLRNKAERTVTFATKDSIPYGRGSSLLNRIIVAAIQHSSGFTHAPRKTNPVKFAPSDPLKSTPLYRVSYEDGSTSPPDFHRVVVRHGPDSAIDRFWHAQGLTADHLDVLRNKWDALYKRKKIDESRVRHWKPEAFSRAVSEKLSRKFSSSVEAAAKKQGFRIESLTCSKQIREDGSSTVAFSIEGLEAVGTPLDRLRFSIASESGRVGTPTLEQSAARLGIRWVPDTQSEVKPGSLEKTLASIHSQSGFVEFDEPLNEGDRSRTFSLSTVLLNGDALSTWEFQQLYPKRFAKGGKRKIGELHECFARIVSVPVETFKMRITLPQMGLGQPAVKKLVPIMDALLRPEGSFYSVPKNEAIGWPEADIVERWELSNLSAQTWELTVHSPQQGGCYALQWGLPDLAPHNEPGEESSDEALIARNEFYRNLQSIETDAEMLRGRLLQYRTARRGPRLNAAQKEIRELLLSTHAKMEAIIQESFEISLMTYNDGAHRLVFVDGVDGASTDPGRPPRKELWKSYLPFGIGLSGTCFRQAEFVFFHFANEEENVDGEPTAYLPILGAPSHRGMTVLPLWHPQIVLPSEDNAGLKIRIDTSKQVLGVLDIGFMADSAWLRRARVQGPDIGGLDLIRVEFSDILVELLKH